MELVAVKPRLFGPRQLAALACGLQPFFFSMVIGRDRDAHGGSGLSYRLDLIALAGGIACLWLARNRPRSVGELASAGRLALTVGLVLLASIQVARGIGLFHARAAASDASPIGQAKPGKGAPQQATLRATDLLAAQLAKQNSAPGIAAMWKGRIPAVDKQVVVLWLVPKSPEPDEYGREVTQLLDEMRPQLAGSPFELMIFRVVGPAVAHLAPAAATSVFVRGSVPDAWSRDSDAARFAKLLAGM